MLSVCRLSRSRTGMRKPSGPMGFMCGTEDGMYAAVVTVSICTVVTRAGAAFLNTFREYQYRVKGGPDLVMR